MNKPLKSVVTLATAALGFALAAPVLAIPSAGLEDSRLPWQVQTIEEIRSTIPAPNAMSTTFPTAGLEDTRLPYQVPARSIAERASTIVADAGSSVFPSAGQE